MKTIVIDTLGAIHIDAVRSESGTATIDLVVHVRSGLREVHPRPARPSACSLNGRFNRVHRYPSASAAARLSANTPRKV